MLLVTEDTDRAFADELKSCGQQESGMRCIVLKLSRILQKSDDWSTQIVETIEYCLGNAGQVFFHDSGDVTMLIRTATRKDFTELVGLISAQLAPASLEGLAFLYELPMDAHIVANLFTRAPVATIDLPDTPRKPAETAKALFNPDHVRSIGLRRKKRTTPDILVVEDDAFLQRLVGNLFTKDFRVMSAKSGADALDLYVQQAPDMVFLDIGLPDINGHDVLAKLLELDPYAYVVMLSGLASRENVLKCLEQGAKGFVGKPFTPEKLFFYVHKCPFIQEKQRKAVSK